MLSSGLMPLNLGVCAVICTIASLIACQSDAVRCITPLKAPPFGAFLCQAAPHARHRFVTNMYYLVHKFLMSGFLCFC